jgi:hypothetical protein
MISNSVGSSWVQPVSAIMNDRQHEMWNVRETAGLTLIASGTQPERAAHFDNFDKISPISAPLKARTVVV